MKSDIHLFSKWRQQKRRSELFSRYNTEYIECCVEQDQVVASLEKYLHTSDDPKEIAVETLKTACTFYDGDWAGVFEVDMDLKIWTPAWWHKMDGRDRTMQLLQEFEKLEVLPTWIQAMETGECIVIPDVTKELSMPSDEKNLYRRFSVESIIAVPFTPNPVGFFVIRNPRRYLNYTTMLTVLAYVLHRALAQQKILSASQLSLSPERIQSNKDIIINFFGNMEIYTAKGVLREQDFKSPKSARVATYLMLHRKATHPPLEIASALWPDDSSDVDAVSGNIRGYIYRFRQAASLISDYQVIESTPNGYRINPELHIMTDLQQFDKLWENAQSVDSTLQKIEVLKKAFDLYRGHVFENASGEHWIMSLSTHYALRYTGLVNELLSTLAAVKDYSGIQQYAMRAYDLIPDNVLIRYWLIYSMYRLGAVEMAKSEISHVKADFSSDEFDVLISYLKKCPEIPVRELLD